MVISRLHRMLSRSSAAGPFDHGRAQAYEFASARRRMDEDYVDLLGHVRGAQRQGSLWHSADDQFFVGNEELWGRFVEHVRSRKCLEIGSGPFGYLAPCNWMSDRVIIDPLVDQYREYQIKLAGDTLFTKDVVTYARPAESLVPELVGQVDGCIVCRNALDHCEDPLTVVHNVGLYAGSGAYLLLWTDLWHLTGLDEGHRNITRSIGAFDALLKGLGFEIIQKGTSIRKPGEMIEYPRLLLKA